MEDDEDCYGFGALSDMFDDRSAARAASSASAASAVAEPKRLDVAAMSRFWWSERRLGEFRRGAQRVAKEYHHVAAKFNGMRVDGGLGSAFLVPRGRSESSGRVEDGGVLWVQAQASDSNAQARRKKEFQDITNRHDALKTPKGGTKSTSTVFLSMSEILDAKETRVQNTVLGITFTLRSGPQFEITFMPGPFYDARNRDEMLEAFNRQQVDDVFSPESSPQPLRAANLPSSSRASSRSSSPNGSRSLSSSRDQTPRQSPSSVISRTMNAAPVDPIALREANRLLIRRYVQLDKGSAEAIAIAQKIHATTEYHVGPLATRFPDFSTDAAYRKQTCVALDTKMKRLNQGWALSEQERELHTRARCGKTGNDTLQYTDTVTDQPIPPSSYQERYMEFVEAEQPEAQPVMRMFEPRRLLSKQSSQDICHQLIEPARPSEGVSSIRSTSPARFEADNCMLFGIDLGKSSLVDASFVSRWEAMPCPADDQLSEWRDILDDSILAEARTNFIAGVSGIRQKLPPSSLSALPLSIDGTTQSHRRSTSRRRSIDQPNLEDVRFQFDSSARASTSTNDSPSSSKRRRSDGDASPTTSRRRRRQSLVGTLNTSLLEEGKTEEPARSASSEVQPKDTICPICCDADAVVVMKPCGHSVCRTCWGRLIRVPNASPGKEGDIRQCPWDREAVVENR